MRREGYIVPYSYHSMAMSKYHRILKSELGDTWSLAMLLPKHFNPDDVKATPRFHEGEHVACYCLPNLWPGVSSEMTRDDAKKLNTILLFTSSKPRGPKELRGFITLKPTETLCLPVGMREKRMEAPCWSCPIFKREGRKCLKRLPLGPRMALVLKFDSVFVLPGRSESRSLEEFIGGALRRVYETAGVCNIGCLRWEGVRKEDVQSLLAELHDGIKDHVECIPCNTPRGGGVSWRKLLEETVKVMCEKMADELTRMCHDDRIRAIWEFAKVLQVVREVCPEACPEEPG